MKKKIRYAVVDLETTGGIAHRDKITEIGIVIHDSEKIIHEWSSLVNPGRSIPSNIVRITGITDEMVKDAPFFYEIAKEVVELTEGAIFVAHNVRFDYGFLKHAFSSLGYTFTRKQLDTVRLSRQSFPGLRSYALGNLIKHFNIPVSARHRALDDARATAIILGKIFKLQHGQQHIEYLVNRGIQSSKLPRNISLDFLHNLPETCGVYYFYNSYNVPIYIGKSIHIKQRIMQHFSKSTNKAARLQRQTHHISYTETGSELAAMLLESTEIKHLQPEINKSQRNKEYPYFLYKYYDEKRYLRFGILKSTIKNRANKEILSHFATNLRASNVIKRYADEYELCYKLCGIDDAVTCCKGYHFKSCYGACLAEETAISYNKRAEAVLPYLMNIFEDDFILFDRGRDAQEASVFLIQQGHYRGYGYISKEDAYMGTEEIMEAIQYVTPNPELNGIVRNYMLAHPNIKQINL